MLNPAGLRVNLFVFHLVHADHTAAVIEDHEAGAGSALIDCCYVLSHFCNNPPFVESDVPASLLACEPRLRQGSMSLAEGRR